jgi:hypothetical protein
MNDRGDIDGWETERILEKLQQDFKRLQEKYHLKPDLRFFTGDAVFGQYGKAGMKRIGVQFQQVEELFDRMRHAFRPVGFMRIMKPWPMHGWRT